MQQAENSRPEIRLKGIAAAPGVGRGPVYLLQKGLPLATCVKVVDPDAEIRRFEEALIATRHEITHLRDKVVGELGESEAAIFDAHLLVLEDVALVDEVIKQVRLTGFNIEFCFQEVSQHYIDIFEKMEDVFLRERASDIRDVTSRVMNQLVGISPERVGTPLRKPVVAAKDLTPSETATLPTDGVIAFVTEEGGRTGHSAIMARSLEIPAVVGVRGLLDAVNEDDVILVDGELGLVVINPTAQTIESYQAKEVTIQNRRDRVMKEIGLPDCTLDGVSFSLQANIGGPEDMEDMSRYYAHGVGLYRTENLFLRLDAWPTEEEQYEEYAAVVKQAHGKLVTFRTLDLGGDKRLGDLTDEANPFMGYRAIRLCLDRPDIFRPQLRAILRAAQLGPAAIMFPMISSLEELRKAKEFLCGVATELASEGVTPKEVIRLGAMIEIPAAVAVAEELAQEVDFFSVGTNDLVQYLLAVDRGNQRVATLYEPAHPGFIRTIDKIFSSAKKNNVVSAVCGELAGDSLWAPLFVGMGVDELSMSPGSIPEVRFILRHSTHAELKSLAESVLKMTETAQIKNRMNEFCQTKLKLR
ncbi:MAG: phosphoenolpyruvate--protein phosphotransferase [Opitutia bacterium]|nr:phosphoenolpyruvate--protein phosphotransferase [Opitutales bacterium]PHX68898.1 MAG: phosphoenolpyruvate--protein phosphotransferase [Opitutae bacterium]